MASSVALIALFSLVLFSGRIIEARKDPGEYWQAAAENEAVVEAIEHLVHADSTLSNQKKSTSDCHTSSKHSANKNSFTTDFEPRPSLSAYGDDTKLKQDKTFMKDFEPRPNISAYGDDSKLKEGKTFTKDFEPRPNVSAYGDDVGLKGEKKFEKDFEPRPNVSVYQE